MKEKVWVSVKDRLPRCGQRVLIVCNPPNQERWVCIATRVPKDGIIDRVRWYRDDGFDIDESIVTHWQKIVLPK